MNNKELLVRVRPNSGSLYEIYFENGGKLPEALKGLFSKPSEAQHVIDKYLREKSSAASKDKRRSKKLPERVED